jgi:hypothetical protein
MSPAARWLACLALALGGWTAVFDGAAWSQDDAPIGASLEVNDAVAFPPEIWSAPEPSLLSVKGFCLPTGDRYRLVVEYETDGAARYRALLVYAEPSHRLLFVQWNGAPDADERATIAETPLVVFEQDSQRRYATFSFRPGKDDRILVQAITPWNERLDVLTGRVASLCDFAVENRVHD